MTRQTYGPRSLTSKTSVLYEGVSLREAYTDVYLERRHTATRLLEDLSVILRQTTRNDMSTIRIASGVRPQLLKGAGVGIRVITVLPSNSILKSYLDNFKYCLGDTVILRFCSRVVFTATE